MTESILNINESFTIDESIEKYEYHEYSPQPGNLDHTSPITIPIQCQDIFVHPSESEIVVEGRLTKADGTPYAEADQVTLCNNGILHLFSNIKYTLSGQQIEDINYPGKATTMLGLVSYPNTFQGLDFLWSKDTHPEADSSKNEGFSTRHKHIVVNPKPGGSFSCCIPLRHIFGFAEDYTKIVYGFKHELTLVRQSENDAIFRADNAGPGKVTLDKVSWRVPHVEPALQQKANLLKLIENKASIDVAFRTRQCTEISVPQTLSFTWPLGIKSSPESPRWIIVGFQTKKKDNQLANASIFDHVDVNRIHVTLNSRRYPEEDYNLSFPENKYTRAYRDAKAFLNTFYGSNLSGLACPEYKDLYPLFVFDVSKQSEKMKNSVTDIQVKATFKTQIPEGTDAFCLLISDKILKFKSDGSKMTVIQS
jgi:hypothetical protein